MIVPPAGDLRSDCHRQNFQKKNNQKRLLHKRDIPDVLRRQGYPFVFAHYPHYCSMEHSTPKE